MIRVYSIKIKRVYAAAEPEDGCRILVDRLWPRGIGKEEAGLDAWVREAAPSAELRRSFAHRPERYAAFQAAYRSELDGSAEAHAFVRTCEAALSSRNLTLLYAAKDEACNNALVLREWVREQIAKDGEGGNRRP